MGEDIGEALGDDMIYPWHTSALARFGVKVIAPPTVEQITLAQAKLHLRIDDDAGSPPSHPDDTLIENLIGAAREWCEAYLGRSIAPQTLELAFDGFPGSSWFGFANPCCRGWSDTWGRDVVVLPMGPVAMVTAFSYVDDGSTFGLATNEYVFANYSEPARLYPLLGTSWPTASTGAESVKVRYIAGYDLDGDSPNLNPLPKSIRAAMLLVLGHLYENRENVAAGGVGGTLLHEIPLGAEALLDPYRLRLGMA